MPEHPPQQAHHPDQSRLTRLEESLAYTDRAAEEAGRQVVDLYRRLDLLARRVEALEKRPVAAAAEKPKPAAKDKKEKAAAASGKKTHTVQKGETVYAISKKYGMKPDELRKLNNLGENDPVKPGQKLVVSK